MREDDRVGKWISGLITTAIGGAVVGFLLDVLGTWIIPQYWGSHLDWRVPGLAAIAAMLGHCFPRKSKISS